MKLRKEDGGTVNFYVDPDKGFNLENVSLKIKPVEAFGFMAANGPIEIHGSELSVLSGNTLSFIANNITIDGGASLSTPDGKINIAGIGLNRETSLKPTNATEMELFQTNGTISISGTDDRISRLNAGNGSIFIRGGQISNAIVKFFESTGLDTQKYDIAGTNLASQDTYYILTNTATCPAFLTRNFLSLEIQSAYSAR